MGVNAHHCPPATHEGTYHPRFPRPRRECEVVILGSAHSDRAERVRALLENFETHVYGPRWEAHGIPNRGMVSSEEVLDVLASAFITVVFATTPGGHSIIKPYIFDYAAAGALVATDFLPALERYLVFDKELIGFENTNEMVRKLRYYLDNPMEAEKIRAAGHNRVLREHTWQRVWPKLLALAHA